MAVTDAPSWVPAGIQAWAEPGVVPGVQDAPEQAVPAEAVLGAAALGQGAVAVLERVLAAVQERAFAA